MLYCVQRDRKRCRQHRTGAALGPHDAEEWRRSNRRYIRSGRKKNMSSDVFEVACCLLHLNYAWPNQTASVVLCHRLLSFYGTIRCLKHVKKKKIQNEARSRDAMRVGQNAPGRMGDQSEARLASSALSNGRRHMFSSVSYLAGLKGNLMG